MFFSEAKWYKLECRHPGKHVSGRLLLKIRLLMSERTTSWAKEDGFVENLKTIAEQAKIISMCVCLSIGVFVFTVVRFFVRLSQLP